MMFLLHFFVDWGFSLGAWIRFAVFMFFYSLILSVPSWFLLLPCVTRINRLRYSTLTKKYLLLGVATLLTMLPFALLIRLLGDTVLSIALPYWLSITFGIFYFKLQTPELPSDQLPQL